MRRAAFTPRGWLTSSVRPGIRSPRLNVAQPASHRQSTPSSDRSLGRTTDLSLKWKRSVPDDGSVVTEGLQRSNQLTELNGRDIPLAR